MLMIRFMPITLLIKQKTHTEVCVLKSGRRDSNSRRSPWQGDALPLSHSRIALLRELVYQLLPFLSSVFLFLYNLISIGKNISKPLLKIFACTEKFSLILSFTCGKILCGKYTHMPMAVSLQQKSDIVFAVLLSDDAYGG